MSKQSQYQKILSNLQTHCVLSFFIVIWGKDVLRTRNFTSGKESLNFVIDNNFYIEEITTEETATIYLSRR